MPFDKNMAKETQSKAKKIYNIVSTVIIAAIFVFLVVVVGLMLWQRKSGGDTSIFGYYLFDVLTDSMSGTIEPHEVILSKKIDDINDLKVGDIITFVAPSGRLAGNNVTHRIVGIALKEDGNVDYFRTKGDNPDITDEDDWQLKPEQVKAKYVRKAKFIGGLRSFLTKWYGYVVLIVLPLTVVGVLIIVGFVRDKLAVEKEKMRAEKLNSVDALSEEQRNQLLEELKKTNADSDTDGDGKSEN